MYDNNPADRFILLNYMKTFCSYNGFNKTFQYLCSLDASSNTIVEQSEMKQFYHYLSEDIHDFSEIRRQLSGTHAPIDYYINPFESDLLSKLSTLPTFHLKSNSTIRDIEKRMDAEHSPNYEEILKRVNISLINNTAIDEKLYVLVIVLSNIVLYFGKGVLDTSENYTEKVKKMLGNYDSLFPVQTISGTPTEILFHMKNALCHGHVYCENSSLRFCN